ncbi:MAG: DUF1801 domain-containing protein, partial [Actinobacteria bacterium]|nr:DUF1801 domain-containing protein [Actinomycetota bacterium]
TRMRLRRGAEVKVAAAGRVLFVFMPRHGREPCRNLSPKPEHWMITMPPGPRSIGELLRTVAPDRRKLVEAARRRILSVIPTAVEKLRPGWGLIGYNAPAYFAFIVPGPGDVRIGFEWGVSLPDPAALLEGDGRQVRYVTIRSARDLRRAAVAELLRAAASRLP